MANTSTLISLLFLVICSFSIQNDCSSDSPTLHFHNNLKPDWEDDVIISCNKTSLDKATWPTLKVGLSPGKSSLAFSVSVNENYDCQAVWWTDYANFKGYTAERDGENKNLYWKMDQEGVFLSYDNSSFVKIAKWTWR